ncbi:MAG: ATP F0F1 synthase subunit B [Pseudomonadota bacterium]
MLYSIVMTAAEAAEAAEAGGLPQLDASTWSSQLFWLALTFGALYWLMSTYFLPRIGAALEERRDRIADDLDRASESRRLAEEAEAAFNRSLNEARAKAQAIAAETREEVGVEVAAMQKEAEAALSVRADAAEARIADMKASASANVREAAAATTRAIVEALILETPADAVVSAAVAKAAKA